MADPVYRVELTASFLERLESSEALLAETDAPDACDALLATLRGTVIPNLRPFSHIGRRYLDQPPQSAEAIAQLGELPASAADGLQVLGSDDYLILYAEDRTNATVQLSIRQHRQSSFDFARRWSGAGQEDV
ncbi:type II toxin-antitoxin system RelE/ParE family toxin [Accumulibacter sp.]|uniref:type II toxin-antitoxin system RelE/ParE family toxin n=1 Tax=Accumulibacter sp. TaxID=2053492 RepID=UPI0025FF4F7B|nr:type II toxin-antitoxin system RelE/ParE family toxin [Accumulibacter sp.]MCM8626980.1 type II toxin-antitoxin system RelE/ParE family toxin [Accumulibacter sp.]